MKKISRRNFLKAAGLAMAAVSLTACGSSSSSSTAASTGAGASSAAPTSGPKMGGTLRFAYGSPIATPGYTPRASGNAAVFYLNLAYDNLFTYDEDGNRVPRLATEWVFDEAEPSITWTLREGVQFADGEPFNAEAVKANIEEYQANNRTEVANIASCEVIDDTHIKMVLTQVNSSTLESVGFFVYYMSPKAIANPSSLDAGTCGTGPFQLSEFENNAYAIYTRNDNYWEEGKPYLDSVEITVISEPTTMSTAFQAGEYDIISVGDMSPMIKQELTGAGIYIEERNTNGVGIETVGLIPNSAIDSPWADARVRRAMCYAIDMDAINAAFMMGTAQLTDQWAVPGSVTYNDELTHFTYNPERAKELLAEAGYADGFDTKINAISSLSDMMTAIGNMLTEVGIRCQINQVDAATQNQLMLEGTWEGLMPHYATVSPDLGLYMGRHLDANGAYYAPGIQHPEKEMELLEAIRGCVDETEKHELEKELQAAIYDAETGSCLFGRPLFINSASSFKYDYVIDDFSRMSFSASWDLSGCWLNL